MHAKTIGSLAYTAALLVAIPTLVNADNCSLATMSGTFGIVEQGRMINQTPAAPMLTISLLSYDGNGALSGRYTASLGGTIVRGTLQGTYQINADCTYSDQLTTDSSSAKLYRAGAITGEGEALTLTFIYTSSAVGAMDTPYVVTGTASRTVPGGCSVATLKGDYTGLSQITYTIPLWGFQAPFYTNLVTIFTSDGKGKYSGKGIALNLNGLSLPIEFTTEYSIGRDCWFNETISNQYGGGQSEGVVTGVGPDQRFNAIGTAQGEVWLITFRKR